MLPVNGCCWGSYIRCGSRRDEGAKRVGKRVNQRGCCCRVGLSGVPFMGKDGAQEGS